MIVKPPSWEKEQNNYSKFGKIEENPAKILLSQKKFLAFLRTFSSFLAILSLFLFFHPREANAGFFDYICFWCNNDKSPVFINEINASSVLEQNDSVLGSFLPLFQPGNGFRDMSLAIIKESALLAYTNPTGIMRDGVGGGEDAIFVYEVQLGDTLSSIASSFEVTVNTILWANDISNSGRIKIGDKLIILPVSGVRHEIKKGDTVSGIAKRYDGNIADIMVFNGLSSGEDLVVGEIIIIPDGELVGSPAIFSPKAPAATLSKLPNLIGFFMKPILNARRSRGIHGKNGVDLVNSDASVPSCGRPVFASAEGTILIAKNSGWNGGYGKYIVISHNNGVQTLYAHLKQIFVTVGKIVPQGETKICFKCA
ncbi:MAG: hypothetical protein A3G49_06920 [Candidatus Sungbacteria bacterium RIFCSPLOWO2_12_FULL_41_11]|uniref:LysM domain-containing protein n=1 Tax=Candidatus Sungbacteria bacterium RIFCSPLOWO2_12_FULL_41_11 TaxID=1802286 RepID=A0A1G2LRI4_9BACT|nr:MAG: hypothetical protein A3G49_06920 [Candidatus Sungbacteria bacterium RIFCSPLOWO2_12_FULL_41_11]